MNKNEVQILDAYDLILELKNQPLPINNGVEYCFFTNSNEAYNLINELHVNISQTTYFLIIINDHQYPAEFYKAWLFLSMDIQLAECTQLSEKIVRNNTVSIYQSDNILELRDLQQQLFRAPITTKILKM